MNRYRVRVIREYARMYQKKSPIMNIEENNAWIDFKCRNFHKNAHLHVDEIEVSGA